MIEGRWLKRVAHRFGVKAGPAAGPAP